MATSYPNAWNNGMNNSAMTNAAISNGANAGYNVPRQMQQMNCPGGVCNNGANGMTAAQQRASVDQRVDAAASNMPAMDQNATNAARGMAQTMPNQSGSLPGLDYIGDPNVPLYQAVPVTAEQIQYLNGFMRSQIGKRVSIEFLIGSDQTDIREGVLLAVGYNYIILSQDGVDAYLACDFYNIKFVKVFY